MCMTRESNQSYIRGNILSWFPLVESSSVTLCCVEQRRHDDYYYNVNTSLAFLIEYFLLQDGSPRTSRPPSMPHTAQYSIHIILLCKRMTLPIYR